MKAIAVVLVLALAGCGSPQRRPTIAAAIAGAAMGFGGCEIDGVKTSTCGIIGGSTAVFLGGIAAIVTALVDTNAHELVPDDEPAQPMHTFTAPPPGLPDAGVPDAPPPDATSIVIDAPLAPMIPVDAAP